MAIRPNMTTSPCDWLYRDALVSAPPLVTTAPNPNVNKFDRIRLLRYLGLNTEDSVLVESRVDLDKHAGFLARLNKRSVRTFLRAGEGRGEPHFPIVTRAEFESACVPLLDQGYALIIAKPIDPAAATLAGCIVRRSRDFLVEVALGPGTVRRVTHEGCIDRTLELRGPDDPRCGAEIAGALDELTAAERRLADTLLLTNVLYEFSAYRHPVGWRSEPIIFWEIQGLGEQDARLDRFYREVVAP